ncbi:Uncharacterised protein [Mycobacterium tuberculosis]|nr:Uncharacterised protein [Mycobacterium tuberculosis]
MSFTVNHSALESESQLSNSVRRMSEGAGRM